MTQPITLPLWLLLLILAFAATSFASNFLFPSVRWFFRRRIEAGIARLNQRLARPIDVLKLAKRQDRIARLAYDPVVLQAVTEQAAETGTPPQVVFQEARAYAREIVPGFSATLYFGVSIRVARWLTKKLYRVRFGRVEEVLARIDPQATVVFVMNHRSNMDYVLLTWLVSGQASISYAVGEWARVWPFSRFIRAMGAYFIRRGNSRALYRKVLARYVQMATEEGNTQAIFPEGGLSLDGRLARPRLGLVTWLMQAETPRDVVFVPVGLSYDRVLEDQILTEAATSGSRRFRVGPLRALSYMLIGVRRLIFPGVWSLGTAAAAFGRPVSLRAFRQGVDPSPQALGARLMAEIAQAIPVLPVPLVAACLPAPDRAALVAACRARLATLEAQGREIRLAPQGMEATVTEALAILQSRGLIRGLTPVPEKSAVLAYYAASLQQDHETVILGEKAD
ncbi:1-acyl-sn-glycerol-3-phosphate acyltransferase [Rhodobacter sp. KR11]|uniref:1-acyl-sn-glycerol-3-phosphate acyltransferase n=1 Tax=Rhodobacter sp. KR11 TaxID=2974588 RepID=UPI002222EBB7|nr:1-acyl-sn-glycerol-3-phosphate acyltransferase [Rhodobacter sp. KR11]MCW1919105.1 1-acyl-sn-glycerol-3-phosphate acyltransferase [Rhodobacter sp. KR11]